MKPPGWLLLVALKAILWLNPLILATGFAISVWALVVSRKLGYLLIAISFVLAPTRWANPPMLRLIAMRSPAAPALTPQQSQEYVREIGAVDKRYFPSGHPVQQTLPFPLVSVVTVTGLWLVARRDIRRRTEPPDAPLPGP